MNRKTLLAALAAASLVGLASTAQAVPAVVAPSYGPGYGYGGPAVIVQSAPPAPLYEAVPAPRAGFIWAPGFHEWRGDRYAWSPGRWVENREGWAWQQPQWQQRGDGSWYLVGGQWVQTDRYAYRDDERRGRRFGPNGDLDRDGVVNQYDRDRDGDGVLDRHDDYPNDPTRR
jgi:hypothetical protein